MSTRTKWIVAGVGVLLVAWWLKRRNEAPAAAAAAASSANALGNAVSGFV